MAGPPLSLADFDEMPVGRLKGIGPKREAGFAALGIKHRFKFLDASQKVHACQFTFFCQLHFQLFDHRLEFSLVRAEPGY